MPGLYDNEISPTGLKEVQLSLRRKNVLRPLRFFVIGGLHESWLQLPRAMEPGIVANEESPPQPSAVASFVHKDGDDALLHLVAEYLAHPQNTTARNQSLWRC